MKIAISFFYSFLCFFFLQTSLSLNNEAFVTGKKNLTKSIIKEINNSESNQKECDETNQPSDLVTFIDQDTFDHLDPEKYSQGLLDTIAPQTEVGKTFLINRLSHPIASRDILNNRTKILNFLIHNPQVRIQLQKEIASIHNQIDTILNTITQKDDAQIDLFCNIQWFDKKLVDTINKSEWLLLLWQTIPHATGLVLTLLDPLMHAGGYLGIFKHDCGHKHGHHKHKDKTKTQDIEKKKSVSNSIPSFIINKIPFGSLVYTAYGALTDVYYYAADVKSMYQAINQKKQAIACLITAINRCQNIIEKDKIMLCNKLLQDKSSFKQDLQETVGERYVPKTLGNLARLQHLLRLPKVKQEIKKMLFALGKIDAYAAIAEAVAQKKLVLCNYQPGQYPLLSLTNGIHPNRSIDQIANSFTYNHKPLIMTGPGGSGKSEYLNMIAMTILVSQSLGVIQMSKEKNTSLVLTPFDYIGLHANIKDARGKCSTSQHEAQKLGNLEQFLIKHPGKKGLVIFDEPLKHNDPEAAAHELVNIVELFKTYPNVIACYATHSKAIGSIKDYDQRSMEAPLIKDTITPTFKVMAGPNITSNLHEQLALVLSQRFNKKNNLNQTIKKNEEETASE